MHRFFCATGLFALVSSAHAGMLVGVDSFGGAAAQSLYSIDRATGEATIIGSTGINGIVGIAWDGSALFGYTVSGDLYSIDTITGDASLRASGGGMVAEGGLDYDADNGRLLASNGAEFGEVDLGTGAFTSIGAHGAAGGDVSGLAYAGGKIFGFAKNDGGADTLVDIDPDTGEAFTIGEIGFDSNADIGGLTFDARRNALFLSDGFSLWRADFGTGEGTLIGNHTNGNFISGLAVIPTPGSAMLAGLAFGMVTRRRRSENG